MTALSGSLSHPEREFFIDNLLVRFDFISEMIWWTGLAPWEFEFPLPGSLICLALTPTLPSAAFRTEIPYAAGLTHILRPEAF